jgi:hypothetical protein
LSDVEYSAQEVLSGINLQGFKMNKLLLALISGFMAATAFAQVATPAVPSLPTAAAVKQEAKTAVTNAAMNKVNAATAPAAAPAATAAAPVTAPAAIKAETPTEAKPAVKKSGKKARRAARKAAALTNPAK